jgi:hypothetical protein
MKRLTTAILGALALIWTAPAPSYAIEACDIATATCRGWSRDPAHQARCEAQRRICYRYVLTLCAAGTVRVEFPLPYWPNGRNTSGTLAPPRSPARRQNNPDGVVLVVCRHGVATYTPPVRH